MSNTKFGLSTIRLCMAAALVGALPLKSSALNAATLGNGALPRWSDQVYMNSINDIYAGRSNIGLIGGDNGYLQISTDRGHTWTAVKGLEGKSISSVEGAQAGQILARNATSYFLSFDFGKSWRTKDFEADESYSSAGFAKNSPGNIWIATTTTGKNVRNRGGIVRLLVTRDGGHIWSTDTKLNFVPQVIRPVDAKIAWARQGTSIFETVDS